MLPLRSVKLFTQFLLLFEAIAPNFLFVGANEANSNGIDGFTGDESTGPTNKVTNYSEVDTAGTEPTECPAESLACVRPNHTNAEMIAMAIESAPSKQMRVTEIYQYLMDKFEFFRNGGDCWKKSVRYVLSRRHRFAMVPGKKKKVYWTLSEYIDTITPVPTFAKPTRRSRRQFSEMDSTACPPENSVCTKPNYYMWELITMAINSTPSKRMKLAEIYNYISDNFEYYRNQGNCWRKTVRWTLTVNKRFNKTPGDEKSYGSFWILSNQTDNVTYKSAKPTISTTPTMTTQASSHQEQAQNASLGSSDFLVIRPSSTFIDKTLWVKTFWATGAQKFWYVTAPPRYGKSTLTSMMRYFFSVKKLENSDSSRKENLETVRQNFKATNLYLRERSFFDEHFQRYPVMFFDFKPLADVTDEATFEAKFCDILCEMYVRAMVASEKERDGPSVEKIAI
ncbi:uncharacterized protein [Bemisia tabaci]|uniref:uncharacterized protein isoform X3 n=1 Tax=Bemisia tabaci TaxID=7038 RepID=UPI003B28B43F